MNTNDSFGWQESLAVTYQEFATQIIAYAPQLLGALVLLVVGWAVSLLLRVATKKIVLGFDNLFKRVAKSSGVRHEAIRGSYAEITSKVVFWTVMIFFIAAATNMLGWDMFSSWMSSIVTYLPNLIAGLLIILAGFLVSNIARAAIINATNSAGIKQGEVLAGVAQIIVLFTCLVVGIEQIGINVGFLTNVLIVVVGVLLAGASLAFGLGAKTLIANIIGAQYSRKHCRIGEKMKIGGFEGIVIEVTQTSIILESGSERTVIPAQYFQEEISQFSSPRRDFNTNKAEKNELGT